MHSEISPKKFHGRVQVFADLTHVMIRWSPGISTMKFRKAFTVYQHGSLIEETESVLLNVGKCSKTKDTHKPGCRRERSPVKEKCTWLC